MEHDSFERHRAGEELAPRLCQFITKRLGTKIKDFDITILYQPGEHGRATVLLTSLKTGEKKEITVFSEDEAN